MANPHPEKRGPAKDKPFREALRMEIAEASDDPHRLRRIAKVLLSQAESGDVQAIREVADRLDGKPAQESNVTIENKRDATDWTRAELVAFLDDHGARSKRAAKANGSNGKSDPLH